MSLQDQYIFILGTTKFDGPDISASFNIALELAKKNHVYYVDYPLTWKDYFKLIGTAQLRARKAHYLPFAPGVIDLDKNLKVLICPPLLSINFLPEGKFYRFLLKINEGIIRRRIRRIIKKEQIINYVYINSFNFHYPGVAKKLYPALTVYHCVDPMIVPYDMKHGVVSERQLVEKSDLVICTSKMLCEEKLAQNKNTHFIPNAADIVHSAKALDTSLPVHTKLAGIKRPIVGYLGSIERRFDFELIKAVVTENPQINFVFAGPLTDDLIPSWFFNQPNIVTLGRVPYSEAPSIIKGFDLAIIPFKKDAVSRTIFPLKLFEYLGAGKAVIATDFNPDLAEKTEGLITFCSDATTFSRAIAIELDSNDPKLINDRIRLASENTWEKRGLEIAALIADNLNHKKNN